MFKFFNENFFTISVEKNMNISHGYKFEFNKFNKNKQIKIEVED